MAKSKRGNYHFLQPETPSKGIYSLAVRQQPAQARISCTSDKIGDRKPLDPAVIVELHIKDSKDDDSDSSRFLYNPFLFAYATLLEPQTLEEIHLLPDGTSRILAGSIASCLYHLKDPEKDNAFGAFFVFPDIAIRQEGTFRLKITLFKISGDPFSNPSKVVQKTSICTEPFMVYPLKSYPNAIAPTLLSRSFAEQGLKLRLRKATRMGERKDNSDSSDSETSSRKIEDKKKKGYSMDESSISSAEPRSAVDYSPHVSTLISSLTVGNHNYRPPAAANHSYGHGPPPPHWYYSQYPSYEYNGSYPPPPYPQYKTEQPPASYPPQQRDNVPHPAYPHPPHKDSSLPPAVENTKPNLASLVSASRESEPPRGDYKPAHDEAPQSNLSNIPKADESQQSVPESDWDATSGQYSRNVESSAPKRLKMDNTGGSEASKEDSSSSRRPLPTTLPDPGVYNGYSGAYRPRPGSYPPPDHMRGYPVYYPEGGRYPGYPPPSGAYPPPPPPPSAHSYQHPPAHYPPAPTSAHNSPHGGPPPPPPGAYPPAPYGHHYPYPGGPPPPEGYHHSPSPSHSYPPNPRLPPPHAHHPYHPPPGANASPSHPYPPPPGPASSSSHPYPPPPGSSAGPANPYPPSHSNGNSPSTRSNYNIGPPGSSGQPHALSSPYAYNAPPPGTSGHRYNEPPSPVAANRHHGYPHSAPPRPRPPQHGQTLPPAHLGLKPLLKHQSSHSNPATTYSPTTPSSAQPPNGSSNGYSNAPAYTPGGPANSHGYSSSPYPPPSAHNPGYQPQKRTYSPSHPHPESGNGVDPSVWPSPKETR
ncbi:velvet factor-domain-containing protein [Globomyces pollinis-pini]|nr:velvet factor-domain-containing protein [Globomyces pollinis-pini]